LRCPGKPVRVTAEQRAELGRPPEGIGDQLLGGERERRVDSALALGDQMWSGGKEARLEPGETLEGGRVGWGSHAHGDRTVRSGEPIGIELPMPIPVRKRHEQQYARPTNRCKMLLSRNQS
jgi:hypothetical protein